MCDTHTYTHTVSLFLSLISQVEEKSENDHLIMNFDHIVNKTQI